MEGEMDFGNEILKRMDKILEVFQLQGLSPNAAGKYEYQAAVYLAGRLADRRSDRKAKKADRSEEEIFRHLERYISACRQLFADGIRLHGDSFFSLLDGWFEEMELATEAVRSSESVRESIAQSFSNPVFHVQYYTLDKIRLVTHLGTNHLQILILDSQALLQFHNKE